MMPRVAIVYLSYNGKKYLDEVLTALHALEYPKDRLELIFVDNASQDGSREYLAQTAEITFFANESNTGFSEGNNIGIRHALLNGADYVFLHNNDLKLDPLAITEAVALAESDERIGSVQSLMLLWKSPDTVNSTGGMLHFLGFGFVRDHARLLSDVTAGVYGPRQDGEEIAYASGAAVLYRASLLQTIGLLDPFLFLYHEDLELGWRIRLAGSRNVLCLRSRAYHDYEFKRSVQKFFWMDRNRWLVHFSHLRWRTLGLLLPFLLILEIPLLLFAIKGGWLKQKLLVYASLLRPRCWMYVASKRKGSRAIRQVSDQRIVSMFTSRIEHQETRSMMVDHIGNPFFSLVWRILRGWIKW